MREHLEVDVRILVAGESDEAHLPLLLRLRQRFDRAVRSEVQIRIVVVDHFVDLPQVEVIGLQPAQRVVQLLERDLFAAAVRADFRHHERAIALSAQRASQALLAHPVVVLPRVVEEVDPVVERFRNDAPGLRLVHHVAERRAADADRRDRSTLELSMRDGHQNSAPVSGCSCIWRVTTSSKASEVL